VKRERALKSNKAWGKGRSSMKMASQTNIGIIEAEKQIRSDTLTQEEQRMLRVHQQTLDSFIVLDHTRLC
jgi:hypothetical protein